jgi:phosphoesterase RecJ-like protein
MDPYKTNRLNHALQKKLSELLETAVKDPRVGFVTVNGVELNRDHTVADVYVSVMGEDNDKTQSLRGLQKARGFLQGRLGKALKLRQVPELRFHYDGSLDRSLNVEGVLRDLEERGEFEDEHTRKCRLTLADFQPDPELISALCAGQHFWLVPHWNPDPDAVGSALALAGALRKMGKAVEVLSYPEPPVGLIDLPGYDMVIMPGQATQLAQSAPPDTLVLVDCHRIDRCGPLIDMLAGCKNVYCIDHHLISGRQMAVPGWVESRACSTATLVWQVLNVLGGGADGKCEPFEIDRTMATCLYAGLLNDTGGFRFPNTMPLTFELAGQLAKLGVDTSAVARQTLHRYRPAGIALLQQVLATFNYQAGGRILILRADQAMVAAAGAVLSDTEGFVNIATAVDGVELVAFMKEIEPSVWRLSLRAPGGGDVQAVASRFGGGGHRQAAGCTMQGEAEEVTQILIRELTAALGRKR